MRPARNDDTFSYRVSGSGPCVLVPRCNFSWDGLGLEELERHFTVVIVDPRGYGGGARLTDPAAYTAEMLRLDLLQACSEAGFERFSVFGYSFTGAVAAWLGQTSDRIQAVVSGGFPLLADYRQVLEGVERIVAEISADPEATSRMESDFDPRAVLSFYREIASSPPASLVENMPCPLFSFWGGRDEFVEEVSGIDNQEAGFIQRDLPFRSVGTLTHGGMLEHLELVLPDIAEWLAAEA